MCKHFDGCEKGISVVVESCDSIDHDITLFLDRCIYQILERYVFDFLSLLNTSAFIVCWFLNVKEYFQKNI